MENTESLGYGSERGNGMDKVATPSAEGLLSKAVIISFKTGRFGNNRKVRRGEVKVSAYNEETGLAEVVDRDVCKVSKELLDSKELQAITSFDAKTRGKLLTYCLPSYVDEGYYFLPIRLIEAVNAYLTDRKEEREYLVNDFLAVYPVKRDAARLRLGPLFREKDYPSEDEVRKSFTWVVRYISFSVPGSLREISSFLFEQEKAKQERMWEDAAGEVRQALREAMAGIVEHAVSKLSYQPNGKPQVFRDSMVKNMEDFLDLFDRRNLTNDDDLAALVGQARSLMAGIDPIVLRLSLRTRDRVRQGFEAIKNTMDSMLMDRPVRSIDFDD